MRARHAQVEGSRIAVEFKGKSGKLQRAELSDRRLARIMRQLQDLPGHELFEYLDEGERRPVRSDDVNAYLREVGGEEITVKDFRTWGASALCLRALDALEPPPAVCRASYVHPRILEGFAAGSLPRAATRRLRGLDRWESDLLRFLRAGS